LWTVTILDGPTYKHLNFNLPQRGYHVCKFDELQSKSPLISVYLSVIIKHVKPEKE